MHVHAIYNAQAHAYSTTLIPGLIREGITEVAVVIGYSLPS